MKKTWKTGLICALAAVLCLSAPMNGLLVRAEELPEAETPSVQEPMVSESYREYLQTHSEYADAADTVRFQAGADVIATDGATPMAEYQGVSQALTFRDGEFTWTFEVQQAGWYEIELQYCPLLNSTRNVELQVAIDGNIPFDECCGIQLERTWINETDEVLYDANGNQYAPNQMEITQWTRKRLTDPNKIASQPLRFALEAGVHTLTLTIGEDPVVLGEILLAPSATAPSYADYISGYQAEGAEVLRIEAEAADRKSDQSLRALSDTSDALMEPYSPNKLRINMIGSTYWQTQGQWLEWDIEVPADGLYQLSFRYRQSYVLGYDVYRKITIDGEVPFREMELINFPFTLGWTGRALEDEEGNPLYVYLTEGTHTLRMEVTLGPLSDIIYELNQTVFDLNEIYRKILMITSANPDPFRDYDLAGDIPDLISTFEANAAVLERNADAIQSLMTEGGDAAILKTLARQLREFCKEPKSIPDRLANYEGNITSLSTWVTELQSQPLDLDSLFLAQADGELPPMKAGFFRSLAHGFVQFFYSFVEDYNSYSASGEGTQITLWTGLGTEQAQILRRMIDSQFTPRTGIAVDMKVVSSSMVEAFLSGKAPDVTIFMGRGQPVNLAIRGALMDLTQFPDFQEVYDSFGESAMRPYRFQNGYYALPDTESFYMMFVRTDILEEINVGIPTTWDEFYQAIPQIQQYNMDVGLPYTAIDVSGSVDAGMGTRNLFPALLMQAGGTFYTDDLSRTALDTTVAMNAFEQWTALYQKYSLSLSYDFFNRFRTGAMPIAIAGYGEYNRLITAAPEIRGLWEMIPIPGTVRADGSLDITQAGSGSGAVILCDSDHPQEAWEFLKWWTGEQAQTEYCNQVEAQLGIVSRMAPANKAAFSSIAYPEDVRESLLLQWAAVENIEEVPGSYYLLRGLDNAFRSVLYEEANPYEAIGLWNEKINQELERKREEFGLG